MTRDEAVQKLVTAIIDHNPKVFERLSMVEYRYSGADGPAHLRAYIAVDVSICDIGIGQGVLQGFSEGEQISIAQGVAQGLFGQVNVPFTCTDTIVGRWIDWSRKWRGITDDKESGS